jgi:hypothetical protein
MPFVLAYFQASATPRPENSNSNEKVALFILDTQLTTYFLLLLNNICISYQLVNKTRNLLFPIELLIYIIYCDRTIIGFVGFVTNLLNTPTEGATVSVRKSASKKELLFVRL